MQIAYNAQLGKREGVATLLLGYFQNKSIRCIVCIFFDKQPVLLCLPRMGSVLLKESGVGVVRGRDILRKLLLRLCHRALCLILVLQVTNFAGLYKSLLWCLAVLRQVFMMGMMS